MVDAREWQVERQVALMSVIWAAARLDLDADDTHKYLVLPRGRWGTRSEALDAIAELMAGPRPVGLAAVPDRLNWYTEPERLAVGIATWQMTPQDRQYWEEPGPDDNQVIDYAAIRGNVTCGRLGRDPQAIVTTGAALMWMNECIRLPAGDGGLSMKQPCHGSIVVDFCYEWRSIVP
jgi:hypothetical protein